jgi:hypothetical protein
MMISIGRYSVIIPGMPGGRQRTPDQKPGPPSA